jgi:thioredoxin 2
MSLHIVCPHCSAVIRVPRERLADAPKCGGCHNLLFNGRPLALTQDSFDKHSLRNDIPLLVDFWAPWCGPCQAMAPAFEQAAAQLEPRFRLAKVNTEEQPALAARFGIRSIPTLALFLHGRELDRRSGAMGTMHIVHWAESFAV